MHARVRALATAPNSAQIPPHPPHHLWDREYPSQAPLTPHVAAMATNAPRGSDSARAHQPARPNSASTTPRCRRAHWAFQAPHASGKDSPSPKSRAHAPAFGAPGRSPDPSGTRDAHTRSPKRAGPPALTLHCPCVPPNRFSRPSQPPGVPERRLLMLRNLEASAPGAQHASSIGPRRGCPSSGQSYSPQLIASTSVPRPNIDTACHFPSTTSDLSPISREPGQTCGP